MGNVWRMLPLFLMGTMMMVQAGEQQLVFRKTGQVLRVRGYVHVHFRIKMDEVSKLCQRMEELGQEIFNFGNHQDKGWFGKEANQELEGHRQRARRACEAVPKVGRLGERERRGVISWIMGAALSLFGLDKLSNLISGAPSDENWRHMVHKVNHQEHRLEMLAGQVEEGMRRLKEAEGVSAAFHTVNCYGQRVTELEGTILRFISGVESLLRHRMPQTLITTEIMKNEMRGIKELAGKLGGEPAINRPEDLYQVETSTVVNEEGEMDVLTHIPVVFGEPLVLYEQDKGPILVEKNGTVWTVKVGNDKDIAVTKDMSRYAAVTKEELRACVRTMNKFFCEGLILRGDFNQECVSRLFKNEWTNINNYCTVSAVRESWNIVRTQKGWYGFSQRDKFYQVNCRNGTGVTRKLRELQVLPLEGGCDATSPDFEIVGSRGGEEMEEMIVHPIPTWNDSELAGVRWEAIERTWRKEEVQQVRKPQVLEEWADQEDEKGEGIAWQMYAIGSGIIGMTLVLAMVVWCIYRVKYLNQAGD